MKQWCMLCLSISFQVLAAPEIWLKQFFCHFQPEKGLKLTKKLKAAEKSVLTNFLVLQAPESWLKYTTGVILRSRKIKKAKMSIISTNTELGLRSFGQNFFSLSLLCEEHLILFTYAYNATKSCLGKKL